MARGALLAAAALALATGCRLDPAGRCDTRADCLPGLDCIRGICAPCAGDADCAAWQACGGLGLCTPRTGRCGTDADCASWESCDGTNTCTLRPDRCPNVACRAIERCDGEHDCTLPAGVCEKDSDCPAWMASCTATNTCAFGTSAGDDLLAWGTLAEGRSDRGAVARVTAPSKVELGFDAGAGGAGSGLIDPASGELSWRALLDPRNGALVYRHVGDPDGDTLRRFTRDALAWDAGAKLWLYPTAPSTDDEVAIAATACPKTWDRWVMQDGTGELLYGCPVFQGHDYYSTAGAKVTGVKGVYAWDANGYLLAETTSGVLQVVSPTNVATPVTGLPPIALRFAWRNVPTGFRVALRRSDGGADQLWEIADSTAAATLAGSYPAVPGAYAGPTWEALDSAGALYGRAYVGLGDLVLKRALGGATTVSVYSEGSAPSNADDFTAATFVPYLRLDQSFLFTRP